MPTDTVSDQKTWIVFPQETSIIKTKLTIKWEPTRQVKESLACIIVLMLSESEQSKSF